MDEKKILLNMLRALTTEIQNIQQKGAGYYNATPFVEKYNKLLDKAKKILGKTSVLIETFSEIEDTKSVDPADKMKVIQRVIIEVSQLVAFIEASMEEETK